ncbi:formyltransferase family protein [Psychrobacter sp. DAB_AL62B]|uniref:formyltransferase family protein n=1 Tax=Psychrobacter sp. DAB_AL62B TaxID=1028420 RepID=UPI002380F595|nr:formyltransferase family protein [Psychrobacter sp. DAB_AL62B]MDE4455118.1 UDP-glucuronic acid dehydrogenase [Psychrobacter sp. DAB_AL62B]
MKISFLCSNPRHPVNDYLYAWIKKNDSKHEIELVRQKKDLSGGDVLFLVSCTEIINNQDRMAYISCLVLHASDLPKGRGWSPHIWSILEGKEELTLTLLEASNKVDSGKIWKKLNFQVPKHALWDEINHQIFKKELELIDFAISNFKSVSPKPQDPNIKPTYYSRRTPDDSVIDPSKSIESQFDKIRVSDPDRFPAYIEMHGEKYKIILEKENDK